MAVTVHHERDFLAARRAPAADLRDVPVASFGAVQAAQARAWLSH
jgi:hypothetical protein